MGFLKNFAPTSRVAAVEVRKTSTFHHHRKHKPHQIKKEDDHFLVTLREYCACSKCLYQYGSTFRDERAVSRLMLMRQEGLALFSL